MRWRGWMVPIVAAAALFISPAAAIAASASSDSVSGLEYVATSAQGRFVGIASGALPGAWWRERKKDGSEKEPVFIARSRSLAVSRSDSQNARIALRS